MVFEAFHFCFTSRSWHCQFTHAPPQLANAAFPLLFSDPSEATKPQAVFPFATKEVFTNAVEKGSLCAKKRIQKKPDRMGLNLITLEQRKRKPIYDQPLKPLLCGAFEDFGYFCSQEVEAMRRE